MRQILTRIGEITQSGAALFSLCSSRGRLFANIFILVYLYCIGFWLCPETPWRTALLSPVAPTILYLGLWQQYRVFAPVRTFNVFFDAEVTFDDGSKSTWHYPRIEKMGFWDKIRNERFRKLANDNLNWHSNRMLWPDFARYVARQSRDSAAGKRPVIVNLVRHYQDIPPPYHGQFLPLPPYESEVFFSYIVRPEDLP